MIVQIPTVNSFGKYKNSGGGIENNFFSNIWIFLVIVFFLIENPKINHFFSNIWFF